MEYLYLSEALDFIGTSGKMTEVCATMGLTSLESLDEIIAINKRNYLAYQQVLTPLEGIQLYTYDESERCNYQYVIVEVDEARAGIRRDVPMKVLQTENVLTQRYLSRRASGGAVLALLSSTRGFCCWRQSGLCSA